MFSSGYFRPYFNSRNADVLRNNKNTGTEVKTAFTSGRTATGHHN